MFADARRYPVIVRRAHVPGELLDDREASTPCGMAIRVFEVDGLKLVSHESAPNVDFFGHPPLHPLAKPHHGQTPCRHGDHIEIRARPGVPAPQAMQDEKIGISRDENALRGNDAEYQIAIQPCTDLDAMPIENVNAGWPREDSPCLPVARLLSPAREAYSLAAKRKWNACRFARRKRNDNSLEKPAGIEKSGSRMETRNIHCAG